MSTSIKALQSKRHFTWDSEPPVDDDSDRKPSCFMSLPLEIRCMIYDDLLRPRCGYISVKDMILANAPHTIQRTTYDCFGTLTTYVSTQRRKARISQNPQGRSVFWLEILSVSKRIYFEACGRFYSQHILFDCCMDGVGAFLSDRSSHALQHVTNLNLVIPSLSGQAQWAEMCERIGKELNLKKLSISIRPWELFKASHLKEWLRLGWVRGLLMINGLDAVDMNVCFPPIPDFVEDLTSFLWSRMLRKDVSKMSMVNASSSARRGNI